VVYRRETLLPLSACRSTPTIPGRRSSRRKVRPASKISPVVVPQGVVTKRAILMLKQDNPDWGCEKSSSMLLRGPALPACPQAVARVLHEAGYETEEGPTNPLVVSQSGKSMRNAACSSTGVLVLSCSRSSNESRCR